MGDNEEMPCKAIRKMKILQKGVEIYQLFKLFEVLVELIVIMGPFWLI
jgi:hypothetical protein